MRPPCTALVLLEKRVVQHTGDRLQPDHREDDDADDRVVFGHGVEGRKVKLARHPNTETEGGSIGDVG